VADELAAEYRLPADRVCVTPLGVDAGWSVARRRRPPGLPEQYVLAVGTFESRKGLDVLLDAYRTMGDVPPLVLAGPAGPDSEAVIRTGYLDAESLRDVVAGAALLVFPSRYEGFGLPPLEALAAGTPVVASDLPATREVLGDHAHLVVPGDADALAAAILETLADPPSGAARQAARDHAAAFTWRRCAEATVAAYRHAIG
jgi:glycosyltransferase involved in cell wall biosynthesis